MHRNFASALITTALLAAACGEPQVDPIAPDTPALDVIAAGEGDLGMHGRRALREMSAPAFRSAVEAGGLVVTVGFKGVGAERGVTARGERLVPRSEIAERLTHLRGLGRILASAEDVPAVTIEVPSAVAAEALRHLPWVDYVSPRITPMTPDVVVSCQFGGSPLSSPQQTSWGVTQINAPQAWSLAGTTGGNGDIAVLDDGLDLGPADYTEVHASVIAWYADSTAADGAHGTRVHSVAVAYDNSIGMVGSAPGNQSRHSKIYDPSVGVAWHDDAGWAISQSASFSSVITISYSTKQISSSPPPDFTFLHDMIVWAYYTHDVIITASTGNQESEFFHAWPAQYDEVVGIGGSNQSDAYVFNNYAPGNVEVAAPAENLLTVCPGGTVGTSSGTSFATPLAAGAYAIMQDAFPSLSNAQIRALIRNTAVPMADFNRSGYGRIDLLAAVDEAIPDPVYAYISGPDWIGAKDFYTWEAMPSGGTGSYTYQWRLRSGTGPWYNQGTAKTHTMQVTAGSDFTLEITASSGGMSDADTIYVSNCIVSGCTPPL